MNVLLVQLRPDEATMQHEIDCFLKQSGVRADQVRSLNVFEKLPSEEDLEGVDALIVGGSGDYLLSHGDIPEKIEAVSNLLRIAREKGLPIMGMCFGAQIIAQTFGGKVEVFEDKKEIGTFLVSKNRHAEKCPIFSELPESFMAQLGHKDHITELPAGGVNMAFSALSEVQAFTFVGEPIYAITFHPELDKDGISWRFRKYADIYDISAERLKEIQGKVGQTPFAVKVLHLFFEKVVKNKETYKVS